MIEIIAVEALRAVIGAVERRGAVLRGDNRRFAIGTGEDELHFLAAIDVARIALVVNEFERTALARQNVGHAFLRIAVGNDEEPDLIAAIHRHASRTLAGDKIAARTLQRSICEQDLHAADGAIWPDLVHADGVLVASCLAVERHRAHIAGCDWIVVAFLATAAILILATTMNDGLLIMFVIVFLFRLFLIAHIRRSLPHFTQISCAIKIVMDAIRPIRPPALQTRIHAIFEYKVQCAAVIFPNIESNCRYLAKTKAAGFPAAFMVSRELIDFAITRQFPDMSRRLAIP